MVCANIIPLQPECAQNGWHHANHQLEEEREFTLTTGSCVRGLLRQDRRIDDCSGRAADEDEAQRQFGSPPPDTDSARADLTFLVLWRERRERDRSGQNQRFGIFLAQTPPKAHVREYLVGCFRTWRV